MNIRAIEQDIKHNSRAVTVGGQRFVYLNHDEMDTISEELAAKIAEPLKEGERFHEIASIGPESQAYAPKLANDLRELGALPPTEYESSVNTIVISKSSIYRGQLNERLSTPPKDYMMANVLGVAVVIKNGETFTRLRQQMNDYTPTFEVAAFVSTADQYQEPEYVGLRVDEGTNIILPHQQNRMGVRLAALLTSQEGTLQARKKLYSLFRSGMRDTNDRVERWMNPELNWRLPKQM